MGFVLAVGLLVSAVIDLVAARLLASWFLTPASAARLQLLGSVLSAVAFASVFLGFWAPETWRFAYALATGLAFRVAYAVYDLPQNSLMALATLDRTARDRVAATRIWFSGLATLLIAGALGPLIAGRDQVTATLYVALAVAVGVSAIAGAWLLSRVVQGVGDKAQPSADVAVQESSSSSRSFGLLLALMFVTSLLTPLFSKVEPFFAVYVIQSSWWGGAIVVSMALGITLGQPLWNEFARVLSRFAVLFMSAAIQLFALGAFWLLAPTERSGLVAAAFAFGLGNGGVGMVLWGGFSEAVASQRLNAGVAYGMFTATAKFALALGSLGLGVVLQSLDYQSRPADGLNLLMTAGPAIGALACLAIGLQWQRLEVRLLELGK